MAVQLRNELEQIPHQPEVGHLEDGRFVILVDRYDGACVLDTGGVLDGVGDADGCVHLHITRTWCSVASPRVTLILAA
jgi:hypothetical protein